MLNYALRVRKVGYSVAVTGAALVAAFFVPALFYVRYYASLLINGAQKNESISNLEQSHRLYL